MHRVISRCGQDTPPPGYVLAEPPPTLEIEKLPPEIWMLIARTLGTQRWVRSLHQTCRYFRSLLTPIMYERIHITKFNTLAGDVEYNQFYSATQLQHVKHLTVDIDDAILASPFTSSSTKGYLFKTFNDRLAHCLNRMPNLITFVYGCPHPQCLANSSGWQCLSVLVLTGFVVRFGKMPDAYEREVLFSGTSNKMPLFNETLTQLRGHKHLRNLSITMHTNAYFDIPQSTGAINYGSHWTHFVGCDLVLNVGGFQNLTSLYLGNINRGSDDLTALPGELASTLAASPSLRNLAFGLYNTFLPMSTFVPKVCEAYEAAGGKPLSLKSLHLGHGRLLILSETNAGYPTVAAMSPLCDLTAVEDVSFFGDLVFPTDDIDIWNVPPLQITDFALSIRRFSAGYLDHSMMSFINTIGNDPTLPPHFMSEMLFTLWEYWRGPLEKLDFEESKSKYWPKVFSIESFRSIYAAAGVRRRIVRKMCRWKGLERLHLYLDLTLRDDRMIANDLAYQLRDNLRVLSLGCERRLVYVSDQRNTDMCIYTKRLKTQKTTLHSTAKIPLSQTLHSPDEKLHFTKKLCAVGNLQFVGICNVYFEIRKAVVKQPPPSRRHPVELAWLHRVTFNGRENIDFYEVLFRNRSF